MYDQSHGLRFDIYERIHLPQDLPGIAALEEVELLPDIQVIQREDRAELHGQLLLTGLYRSEDDRTNSLEHSIPVEITVPLARVSSLDEIGVEIENFDIDLLTMRSVNITGVLSLRGIGGAEPVPAWQREEFTVAYSPDEEVRADAGETADPAEEGEGLYENSLWTYGEGITDEAAQEREQVLPGITQNEDGDESPILNLEENQDAKIHTESSQPFGAEEETELGAQRKTANSWSHFAAGGTDAASPLAGERTSASETAELAEADGAAQPESADASDDDALETFAQASGVSQEEALAQDTGSLPEPPLSPEDKQDLKIALGTKKDSGSQTKEHLTFSSLLSSGRAHEQEEVPAEKASSAAPAIAAESSEDTEWKSRFVRDKDGAEAFRKVRLCIVQREDTLDTIAEKYQLSARELVLYNRLSEQTVEEGQVLYIP
ncbi:stage VI sporulation protein D [Paenibacillus forsythiae]|uniref:Stage VI sporulation protein D n=1 Tax=Paenibacillus forsythiae TaxID=365616 RepID=A0ABU3HDR8_9BACL|nr:LysM peptidoglycan-binding domain-containing protein [Paenibacillus forsythiae]MDT3428885.1 stage VI sporulation protein D [Paenibacillus forsythiae]